MILGLGLALAAPYDTPEVLEGRPLRRAERRCRRGNADACAVLGFTFLFSERPVEGEALIHSSCSKGSPLGCHLVSAGVLEGWWAGDLEAAQAEVDAQCLQDDILLSCRLARYALSDPTPHLLHACGLGDSLACGEYALRTQRLTGTLDVERLEVACADGYFCGALGNALMFGVDVEPDPKRGLALSTTECEGGDLRACADVAMFARDDATLAAFCANGVNLACSYRVDLLFSEGRDEEAKLLTHALCESGDGYRCGQLALMEEDDRRKLQYAGLSCDAGSRAGCWMYASMLLHGQGTDPQPRAARPLLEEVCEEGIMGACNSLGIAYAMGCGVEPDYEQAAAYWRQSCEQGFTGGCGNLGELLWHLEGPEVGGPLLLQACADGSEWSCGTWAALNEDAEGLAKACEARPDGPFCVQHWAQSLDADPELIANLEQACAQAESESSCNDPTVPWASQSHRACTVMGALYLEGRHVVRDEDYGWALIERACTEGGDYEACQRIDARVSEP